MRYIELFAGIGGMGHGLMQAGMECVGYAECDTKCETCGTYTQHFRSMKKQFYTYCGTCGREKKQPTHESYHILHDPKGRMWDAYDVTTVTDDDIRSLGRERGPIQLIAGGFPCQAFSIAGKRQGFADSTRGTLFFEIVRFASILRPEYLLLENVTGLLNHDEGRTFETVIRTLDELGYVGEWCVLNSAAYVPQNRERVFIVASLGGQRGRKIFPFGSENANPIEVIGRIDSNQHDQNRRVYSVEGIAPALTTMGGGGQEPKIMIVGSTKPEDSGRIGTRDVVYDPDGLMGCLQATDYKQPKQVLVRPVLTPDREEKRQNGRRFKEPGEPMFTLTAQDKHGVAIIDDQGRLNKDLRLLDTVPTLRAQAHGNEPKVYNGYRIRKLTPLECFRLQSFPDWWYYKLKEHGISDSQLYKMAGNAVTSEVARQIGIRLLAA